MIEEMKLRNFSPATRESYVYAVSRLTKYHHKSPDQLSKEDIRAFLVHLAVERKLSLIVRAAPGGDVLIIGGSKQFGERLAALELSFCEPPAQRLQNSNDWLGNGEIVFALRTFSPRMIVNVLALAGFCLFVGSTA
jgi:Phage integrase, N-terminal SAM-like domain